MAQNWSLNKKKILSKWLKNLFFRTRIIFRNLSKYLFIYINTKIKYRSAEVSSIYLLLLSNWQQNLTGCAILTWIKPARGHFWCFWIDRQMEGGIRIFDELTPRRQQKTNGLFDMLKIRQGGLLLAEIGFSRVHWNDPKTKKNQTQK